MLLVFAHHREADPQTHFERAWDRLQAGQFERALAECDKALQLKPDLDDVWVLRGAIHVKTKEYDKAVADFDRAIALKPSNPEAYFNRAVVWREQRQFTRVLADVETGLRFKPGDANAYYLKGLAHDSLKQPPEALEAYRRCVELASTHTSETLDYARRRIKEISGN